MINDYWTLRNDPEFIKSFLPGIENVLGWFTRRIDKETGLLGKVLTGILSTGHLNGRGTMKAHRRRSSRRNE